MDLSTLTIALLFASLAAKTIYIAVGILPNLETAEIKKDLNEYLGIVETNDDENEHCQFIMLSKHPLYWLPLVAPLVKRPYTNKTDMAKFEVFIIEIFAIAFVLAAYLLDVDIIVLLFSGVFIALTLTATLVDVTSRFLPDKIVYPLLWIGLFFSTTQYSLVTSREAITGALVAYLCMYSFNKVTYLKSGKDSLAWGDIRLVSALGAWIGLELAVPMMTFSLATLFFLKKGAAFGPVIVLWAYVVVGCRLLGFM